MRSGARLGLLPTPVLRLSSGTRDGGRSRLGRQNVVPSISIRSQRSEGFALLIACLVVGITGTLHELPKLTESSPSASQNSVSPNGSRRSKRLDQLFVASAHFAAERGLTVAALSAPQPIGPAEMASIRQRRMLADQTLARAEQHLLQIRRSTIRERVLSRIVVAQGRVTSLRAGIDREATKPVEQRVQPVISQSLETPTGSSVAWRSCCEPFTLNWAGRTAALRLVGGSAPHVGDGRICWPRAARLQPSGQRW